MAISSFSRHTIKCNNSFTAVHSKVLKVTSIHHVVCCKFSDIQLMRPLSLSLSEICEFSAPICLLGTHPWGEINDQGIHLTCFIIHSGERAETRVRERKRDDGRRWSKWVGVRSSWEGEKGSHRKENTGSLEKSFYMGFQFTALCFAIFMFLWFQYQFIAVKASTNCQSDRKIVANILHFWDFEPNACISYFLMR